MTSSDFGLSGTASTLDNYNSFKSVPYKTNFCVIYDVWKAADEFRSGEHITLLHHATPEYLKYLKNQLNSWDGGISLSVYISLPRTLQHDNEFILAAAHHLQAVLKILDNMSEERDSKRVSLHLFFARNKFPVCPTFRVATIFSLMTEHNDTVYSMPQNTLYPINPARNIARLGSHTEFFISGDIEQVFAPNAEKRLYKLAKSVMKSANSLIVLVHRRFEISENAKPPKSKNDLMHLLETNQSVPFHELVFAEGHHIDNLTEWLHRQTFKESSSIQFFAEYYNAEWEPQFVADSRAPFHDDRFPFRLRSNTHLSSQMCHMGYKFAIVDDIFTYHRGIKLFTSESEKALKKISLNKGYKWIVRRFNAELIQKYPEKKALCNRLIP